jgi:poly(3-hydroxybutyrate) depolymerase
MTKRVHNASIGVILAVCTLSVHAALASAGTPYPERQCARQGWHPVVLNVEGLQRRVLWKGPDGPWTKGAILVMHGGGGHHFHFCVANARIVGPQVRFTDLAIKDGFAVFLIDSSDRVTDNEGRLCGKVWDDEVRNRPNLDLPFIGAVIRELVPQLRPSNSRSEVFVTGLSSGGYMTVRAATYFDNLVTAFAPVSSGDPYGWHRVCEAGATARTTVHGAGFDNETGKRITERDACRADAYANENPWDSAKPTVKPRFRIFRHEEDSINDRSCGEKIGKLLRRQGYGGLPDFVLRGGRRSLANHLWLDAYNRPILDFFSSEVAARSK